MKKRRLKEVLYGSEIRIMGIIANGLVHKTPKAVIFRNMKKEILRVGTYLDLEAAEIQEMWVDATRLYGEISKETFSNLRKTENKFGKKEDYEEYLVTRREEVYRSVHKHLPDLEKNKNSIANTVEYRVKNTEFRDMLGSDNVFYICNWFEDCAKDHVPYQGKVYVSDDWEDKVSEEDKARIAAYIKNHNVMTVREVMQNPPYLVTRRNCRHQLYPISVDEVLGSSVNRILKRHDLKAKHENEYNMVLTPDKVSYIAYYERLKALNYLKKLFNCKKLDEDIKETRKLVRKWRRAVKE